MWTESQESCCVVLNFCVIRHQPPDPLTCPQTSADHLAFAPQSSLANLILNGGGHSGRRDAPQKAMAGKNAPPAPTLLSLPPAALARVAAHVMGHGGVISAENARSAGGAAVALSRTHPALRRAARDALRGLRFPGAAAGAAWPAARALGASAGDALREVSVTVDRGRVVGFYKWLLGAGGLRVLRLRVVGAPYARDGLAGLERVLLGRAFFQAGRTLREVEMEGVDAKAAVMSAVCRCSRLQRLRLRWHSSEEGAAGGDEQAATVTGYMFVLLCLVNRASLVEVAHPFGAAPAPERAALAEGLQGTWGTLWGNYRAGAKEAAANLPESAEEMRAVFEAVSAQMDEIEATMAEVMRSYAEEPKDLPRDENFDALLRRLLPSEASVTSCTSSVL